MTDATAQTKPARERSPSFPFIPLKTAIERLRELDEKFGRQPAPADRAYLAWGFKGDTSQAQQTLAALKSFGLVEYQGSGPKRLAFISDTARTYLRANQLHIKKEILKRVATTPNWISRMWDKWGASRHPDEVCLDELVLDHKFNENTAPRFLSVYDQTIAYAGLSESDKVTVADDGPEDDPLDFSVGDVVNWESQGQIQWKTPRKIIGTDKDDEGRSYFKVEGHDGVEDQPGWIPVEQAIAYESPLPPSGGFAPPLPDPNVLDRDKTPKGFRKAVFPIDDDCDVTLIFPKGMTPDQLADLDSYLTVFLGKEKGKAERGS